MTFGCSSGFAAANGSRQIPAVRRERLRMHLLGGDRPVTGDPLDRIEAIGPYHFLTRVPGDSPERRFVATNKTTAEGARAAGWEVVDLETLVEVARAARAVEYEFRGHIGQYPEGRDLRAALARLDKEQP